MGKRGLRLIQEGNIFFANNLLHAIRNIWNNINNDFVCNNNLYCNFQQETKGVTVDEISKNIESNVTELLRLRNTYLKYLMIVYLNINYFENKVINFREICHQAPIDIICVDETKLDSSYPDSQFHIDGNQFQIDGHPFHRDKKEEKLSM